MQIRPFIHIATDLAKELGTSVDEAASILNTDNRTAFASDDLVVEHEDGSLDRNPTAADIAARFASLLRHE